jgi:hypothetical protein
MDSYITSLHAIQSRVHRHIAEPEPPFAGENEIMLADGEHLLDYLEPDTVSGGED